MAVCENEAHKDWLWNLLKTMFLAIVVDKSVDIDREVTKNVSMYLQHTVNAAKQYLPSKNAPVIVGQTGDNDSDDSGE